MKLRPLQDRILVQRVEEETTTKGGIIIPDTAKEKPAEGKVTAVGNGKVGEDGKRIALEVKKGDRILFGKYSGTEVKVEGEELLAGPVAQDGHTLVARLLGGVAGPPRTGPTWGRTPLWSSAKLSRSSSVIHWSMALSLLNTSRNLAEL